MNAVVWHGRRDLRLEIVAEPDDPGPGEALVAVAHCGICGTDLHEYTDGPVMIRPGTHPLTGTSPPIVLGHEFSGTVFALGPGAQDSGAPEVGERVTVDPCWSCGSCFWCLRGDYHICRTGGSVGLASHGALAPIVRVPAVGLIRLPDSVDDRVGALVEPLAVGLHAVRRGGVQSGDRVLIRGFGPVGAAVLLAAVAVGVAEVFVIEPGSSRRELALAMGATDVFDPTETNASRDVYRRTDRVGPDIVFDCTGVPQLLPEAIDSARRGGRIVSLGVGHGQATVTPGRLALLEREVIGSLGYNRDHQRVIELLTSERLDPSLLITGRVPLLDAVSGGFDALLADDGEHLKMLIDVSGGP